MKLITWIRGCFPLVRHATFQDLDAKRRQLLQITTALERELTRVKHLLAGAVAANASYGPICRNLEAKISWATAGDLSLSLKIARCQALVQPVVDFAEAVAAGDRARAPEPIAADAGPGRPTFRLAAEMPKSPKQLNEGKSP